MGSICCRLSPSHEPVLHISDVEPGFDWFSRTSNCDSDLPNAVGAAVCSFSVVFPGPGCYDLAVQAARICALAGQCRLSKHLSARFL
jgi:hypothetical protein